MANSRNSTVYFLLFTVAFQAVSCSLFDYFLPQKSNNKENELEVIPTVPYEVNSSDEKFLREASKLIGTSLSDLDICHHRVILNLKKSCHELNAEQLGKLSVMLLNCQSYSEGRSMYECTENMNLKDCTLSMDANTWNAYHLITNRAKAVCAAIRQEQFRGLAEITVNKLMQSAHEQISLMDKLSVNQQNLERITSTAIDELSEKNEKLIDQQKQMLQVSQAHRTTVETNLHELMREKSLIKTGQLEVAGMVEHLKKQLDATLSNLRQQSKETKQNHAALTKDLFDLHDSAFRTNEYILTQNELAAGQFEQTIRQLNEVNETIVKLATVLRHLENDLDSKLTWIAERVGGTETFVNNISLFTKYLSYLLLGMLLLVFINASSFYRSVFVLIVPINFSCALFDSHHLDIIQMSQVIFAIYTVKFIHKLITTYDLKNAFIIKPKTPSEVSEELHDEVDNNGNETKYRESSIAKDTSYVTAFKVRHRQIKNYYDINTAQREGSITPSVGDDHSHSRSATPYTSLMRNRIRCIGYTLKGEQCRHAAIADGDFCRIHAK